ncbi:MAG: GIY-YIG nuclease family protein [Bacteroidota bacterium]
MEFVDMLYTYILQSEKSERYYIGHTSDLEERLSYHNNGRVKATRNKGPWKIVYIEEYETKNQANQRELEIKKKKSRKYIEFLINNKRE